MEPELKNVLRNALPEYRPLAAALYDNGFTPWWGGISDSLLIVDVRQANRADGMFRHVDRLKACFVKWGFKPRGEITYQVHAFDVSDASDVEIRIEVEGVAYEDFTNLPPCVEDLSFSDDQIRIATVAGMSAMSAYLAVNGLPAQKNLECNSKNVEHWCGVAREALDMKPPEDRLEEVFHAAVLDVLDVDRIER